MTPSRNGSAFILLVVAIATIVPFWSVEVPPSTDLPQHLSQAFLWHETISGRRPELALTPWYYPNTLIYAPLLVFWKLTTPLVAGRLILTTLAAAWIAGTYAVSKALQRPLSNWLISTAIAFNFLFSWGLLNFLIGWPIFCMFIAVESMVDSRKKIVTTSFLFALLYFAHALWFLVANIWLLSRIVDRSIPSWRYFATSAVPTWCCALWWYPQLASQRRSSGVDTSPTWVTMPIEKLDLTFTADSMQGMLQSDLSVYYLLFVLGWVAVALVSNGRHLAARTNRPLLLAAIVLFSAYWILPWKYMNTIFFDQRWLPCAMTLLLLALPSPKLPPSAAIVCGLGWQLVFSASTISAFQNWQQESLDGFIGAINEIQVSDRVFGLNLMDGSLYIKGTPGLQLFSYSQALRGAETNFSFTEHNTGIVQFKTIQRPSEIREFVNSPLLVRREHLRGFNRILIHGDSSLHDFAKSRLGLEQMTEKNTDWRLYRIRP